MMTEKEIQELEEIIRSTGRVKGPEALTDQVMDKINDLPVYMPRRENILPVWFRIFMVLIFAGAFLFVLIAGNHDTTGEIGFVSSLVKLTDQIAFLINNGLGKIFTQIWILPLSLFLVTGFVFVMSDPNIFNRRKITG